MKIASWNINGIAAHRRELIKFLTDVKPDVMCIQETRGQTALSTPGYHNFWFSSTEPNFSGTLVLSKREPLSVKFGIGIKKYDREGRAITVEYKDFYVVNVYVPNYQTQSPPERRKFRLNWDMAFRIYISKLPKPVVICGDFNVTYTDMDIYPSEARSSTVPPDMITEERKNFERLLDVGFKDVFRTFYPEKRDAYTWWAPKNQNRIHNKGSRLDYFLVSNELLTYVKSIKHYTDTQGSDHCPICILINVTVQCADLSDQDLADQWEATDWLSVKKKVHEMQAAIAQATYNLDWVLVSQLQDKLTASWNARALAVYEITNRKSAPGVDGVVWQTASEKANAVRSLTPYAYTPLPYLHMNILDKNGKHRNINIASARDRAMIALYTLALSPVAETTADKKTFSARGGRTKQDLHAYLFQALDGPKAPKVVVIADIRAFYESAAHRWMIDHIPMNKTMLRKFLKAGVVRNGDLFDTNEGMSMAISISPLLANMMLDGLQTYLYDHLYPGTKKRGYANGEVYRWADDILITADTWDQGEKIVEIITEFLAERGLGLNQEKTKIKRVSKGFTFMSRTYQKTGDTLVVRLSPHSDTVQRHVRELEELILGDTEEKFSPETLINRINRKNASWMYHYRDMDAYNAFRYVDAAVNTFLLHRMKSMYSPSYHKQMEQRFWTSEGGGRYVFVCPSDPSIQVIRLAQTRIVRHKPCKVSFNPYFDQNYLEWLRHYRDIQKANGNYRIVWDRQEGKCAYCGQCMLADQEVDIVERTIGKGRRLDNLCYIHRRCAYDAVACNNDYESGSPINLVQLLEDYIAETSEENKISLEESPYAALTEYFRCCELKNLTLHFNEIENLLGRKLSWEAGNFQAFWVETSFDVDTGKRADLWEQEGYPIHAVGLSLPNYCIADSWLKYGYKISLLDLERKKISFRRGTVLRGTAGRAFQKVLRIEKALMRQKLSHNEVKQIDALLEQVVQGLRL